jgi:hypothetical protein
MQSKQAVAGAIAMAAILSASLLAWAQAGPDKKTETPPLPAFKPVLSVHDMMEGQNKLFGEITDGITDKKYRDAAKAAWLLAEIANVNQYQHDDDAYRTFAKKMSEDCVKLARALKKGDEKAAVEARRMVSQTCQACHDQFKK